MPGETSLGGGGKLILSTKFKNSIGYIFNFGWSMGLSDAPSIQELRRSYFWACRYLDSLYRDGTVREYHTRTPFASVPWKKIGENWYPMNTHPIGLGMPKAFTECVTPMQWHHLGKVHREWSYVHNATRDYNVIARIGFEDTEPDWIVVDVYGSKAYNPLGDPPCPITYPIIPPPYPCSDEDCNEPTIIVEYTRNRIKNGFFNFRIYRDLDPEKDLPTNWALYGYPEPWPEGVSVGLTKSESYAGPYSLYVWYWATETSPVRVRYCELSSDWIEILPDTEYVASMYFKGKINYNSVLWGVYLFDRNGNYIDTYNYQLGYGEYKEWKTSEIRFRTPKNAYYASVFLDIWTNYWPYSGGITAYFDAFWLSECPINLKPHYTLAAQIEGYEGERKAHIYFNGNRIWSFVSRNNLPRNVYETTVPLEGIPANRSAIRHSVQNAVFYYRYSSMHPEWKARADTLQAFREKYGFTTDIYHVLWRESETYPDDFMVQWESVHDCDVWFTLPKTYTFYPYWSKMCQCRSASNIPTCGYLAANWFWAICGMHVLNKYGDPYRQILVPRCVAIPIIYEPAKLAKDLLRQLAPYKGLNVNWPATPELYPSFANACALAFLSELGYGFRDVLEAHGDSTLAAHAREWADNLAITLLGQQWLGPPERPGLYRHEDFDDVDVPEFAGGFCTLTIYRMVDYVPVPYATSRIEWFAQFADIVAMPFETPGMIAVNQEATFTAIRALQIYEWYKYKGGKRAFPKLLMPADVDGDGWVSELDLAKVKLCVNEGLYDPLCDINGDGVIDEKDLSLVKANLGRGEPRKGIIWLPTTAKTKVEVS